jgi:hypothetical protein
MSKYACSESGSRDVEGLPERDTLATLGYYSIQAFEMSIKAVRGSDFCQNALLPLKTFDSTTKVGYGV